ncbi:hypothetical protein ACFXPI_09980 [Streptomyces sp. NPDC059104]|uniref:hypothetical protein n=1 Tax=Streptomyces sp. NPDC059104 TaxID=3346729 RepID=UPI0036C0EE3C
MGGVQEAATAGAARDGGAGDGGGAAGSLARRVTDGLEPRTWIIAVAVLVGWHAAGPAGVGWGAFAGFFCGVVPMLWIRWGQRRGYWGDRHVRRRQDRLIVLPGVVVSVAVCVVGLQLLRAPREMTALVVAMLATVLAILVVTTRWKISVHTAVAGGAVVLLGLTYGPGTLAGYVLVALVGWSRVRLRDHTPAQAASGTVLGAAVAGPVFLGLA